MKFTYLHLFQCWLVQLLSQFCLLSFMKNLGGLKKNRLTENSPVLLILEMRGWTRFGELILGTKITMTVRNCFDYLPAWYAHTVSTMHVSQLYSGIIAVLGGKAEALKGGSTKLSCNNGTSYHWIQRWDVLAITTPNYPDDYCNNLDLSWLLETDQSGQVCRYIPSMYMYYTTSNYIVRLVLPGR